MKLIEKYLSKIDLDNIKNYGGYNWINPYIKETPLKNVIQLGFRSLYPNILCGMIEDGIHKTASESVQEILESFKESFEYFDINKRNLKLSDPDEYLKQKGI